jgi:hypothetical protein
VTYNKQIQVKTILDFLPEKIVPSQYNKGDDETQRKFGELQNGL